MDPYFLGFAISIFSLLLLLVNVILFLSKYRKFKSDVYTIVAIYLLGLFCVEFFCNIIGYLNPGANFFLSHYYFNTQFLLLSIFFYKLFNQPKLKKIVVVNFIIVFTIIITTYIHDPTLYWKFNLFEIVATSLLLIIYALIHIYNLLGETKQYFYLTIGLVIYLLCSCMIYLSGNYELVFIKDPYIDIWVFNSIFYIVYQLLIYVEWKHLNKQFNNV